MYNPYQDQINQLDEQIKENEDLLTDPELSQLAQDEIARLTEEKKLLEKTALEYAANLENTHEPTSDMSQANCIMEIHGGAGGDEAKIWATELLRMYTRYLENKGLKISYIDDLVFKVSGKTELLIPTIDPDEITSENKSREVPSETILLHPYELLKYEGGVHRVQRVPVTEAQGRIHTSTASLAVLPEVPKAAVEIKEEDLVWEFMRSSGAGGQSVNKTSSAVRLIHKPSGIVVVSRQERKQFQNREIALDLLRSRLWEIEEEKREQELGKARSVVGRAMRSEKIRTFNFPQNRVTDHRLNKSWYALERILDGELDSVIAYTRFKLELENE